MQILPFERINRLDAFLKNNTHTPSPKQVKKETLKSDRVSISEEARLLLLKYHKAAEEEAERVKNPSSERCLAKAETEKGTPLGLPVLHTPEFDEATKRTQEIDEAEGKSQKDASPEEKKMSEIEIQIKKLQQQIIEVAQSDLPEEVKEVRIASLQGQISKLTQELAALKENLPPVLHVKKQV